jgi:hypothetical protein
VPQTCWAYVERADANAPHHTGVTKFDIRLLNESGEALVKFKNLYVRPLASLETGAPGAAHAPAKGQLISLSGGAGE